MSLSNPFKLSLSFSDEVVLDTLSCACMIFGSNDPGDLYKLFFLTRVLPEKRFAYTLATNMSC